MSEKTSFHNNRGVTGYVDPGGLAHIGSLNKSNHLLCSSMLWLISFLAVHVLSHLCRPLKLRCLYASSQQVSMCPILLTL